MSPIPILTILAISYVGIPYIWGGSNPLIGLDCSGFVQIPLKKLEIIEKNADFSSQSLYFELVKKGFKKIKKPEENCILFFGDSFSSISHVAIAIDDVWMVNSRGGDNRTTTKEDAIKKIAMVEITKINSRKDLLAIIKII